MFPLSSTNLRRRLSTVASSQRAEVGCFGDVLPTAVGKPILLPRRLLHLFLRTSTMPFMVVDAKKQARWWNLWPKISDAESARRAAMRGCWAAVISAVVTALVVAAGLYGLETVQGVDAYALVDVALLVLLAWGIRKMFRAAAVIALVYFVGSKVLFYSANGVGNPIVFIVFCLLYINGVRGTYAYRRFKDGGVAAA